MMGVSRHGKWVSSICKMLKITFPAHGAISESYQSFGTSRIDNAESNDPIKEEIQPFCKRLDVTITITALDRQNVARSLSLVIIFTE